MMFAVQNFMGFFAHEVCTVNSPRVALSLPHTVALIGGQVCSAELQGLLAHKVSHCKLAQSRPMILMMT